ncbi:hypothetical protein, partial [Acinetobacter baumannii]|uniref:hypothetical protein n=1 Tax=Acinetobacter baumannii TaxID=470 RepID=UPI00227C01C9
KLTELAPEILAALAKDEITSVVSRGAIEEQQRRVFASGMEARQHAVTRLARHDDKRRQNRNPTSPPYTKWVPGRFYNGRYQPPQNSPLCRDPGHL